jgi:putative transposase
MGIKRLSHAVYDTRYHLVWAPKYRKWILKDEVRTAVEGLFREILVARDCEIEEMEIAEDHVHVFTSIPPKYSVGQIVRIVKSVSAREIFRRYPEVKRELWGGEFWEDGYFVRTVGDKVTSETIKKYIQYHRHEEKTPKQLGFGF